MTTDSHLLEDEGGGGEGAAATCNSTTKIENPVFPMPGPRKQRVKKRKDLEEAVDEFITEAFKKAWIDIGLPRDMGTGNTWLDDAQTAKNQGQGLRYHQSMAEYHRGEAVKHSKGDSAKADFHRAAVSSHLAKAEAISNSFKQAPVFTPPQKPARAPEQRVYYNVPFAQKDEAKKLGMKWDPDKKKWYIVYIHGKSGPKIPFKTIYESVLCEDLNVPNLEDGLNKRRHTMPQLKDFATFSKDLSDNGIDISAAKDLDPKKLTPTQSNFNEDKVRTMIDNGSWNKNPIIVSSDDYVIDGHHRWLAACEEKQKVSARVVDKSAEDLLDFLKGKEYVIKQTIKE